MAASKQVIKPVSQGLEWLTQMLQLFAAKQINVPSDFKDKCIVLENELNNDYSGLVNSIVDLSIASATVDITIESDNKSTAKFLNEWLQNVNSNLRGKIPTGITPLQKQYYIERWRKSSLVVLRSVWEDVDGWFLPTKLWFVDGKSVVIEDDQDTKELGAEKYYLRITKDKKVPLKDGKYERIFIQRPFEDWGCEYPTPFLIKRGTYYNLKFMQLLVERGSNVVAKALEYLMILKKGDADLAKLNRAEFIYDKKELTEVKESLQAVIDEMRVNRGSPLYVSNFDTSVEHLIPDYAKVLNSALYIPVEQRIMASLGFIETISGVTQNRKDAVMNPKAFIAEVNCGVSDFKALLHDVLMTIIEENRGAHKKLTNADRIQVRSSPVKTLYDTEQKDYLRSLYDRGLLSKQTLVELTGEVDYEEEVERRGGEQTRGEDEKSYPADMYPPIVQNQPTNQGTEGNLSKSEKTSPDKKGPEKKNYKNR